MSEKCVSLSIEDNIAFVTLNRPEKRNALDMTMFKTIDNISRQLRKNREIRAVIVQANGEDFCSGLDVRSVLSQKSSAMSLLAKWLPGQANLAQRVSYNWRKIPVPVIMVIHGRCWGGGLQIALGADFRFASEDASFSIMEGKWGLIPDMSGTQTLKDLVRLDVAKELTFTGRIVEAEEALRLGLITRICEYPLAEAEKMAREIAGKSPDAIAAGKQLWENVRSCDTEEGLKLEESLQRALIGGHNQLEAVKANFEKRPPLFKQRS